MNDVNFNMLNTGDSWNNTSVSFPERIVPPAAVASINHTMMANIFPNPATSSFNITLAGTASGPVSVSVYDLNGKAVAMVSGNDNSVRVNTAGWASGLYTVVVERDGCRQLTSIAKQ
jgi:hypothetical protein